MLRQSPSIAFALASLSILAGCGGRTPLLEGAVEVFDAGAEASADASAVKPDAAVDATVDQSDDAMPPPTCVLIQAGEPVVLAPSPSVQSYSPSIVAVRPGNEASLEPAHVVGTWLRSEGDAHPATVARDYEVGTVWPAAFKPKHEAIVVGPDSHTWNELALAPDVGSAVSLVWWDDPGMVGRLRFRTLDVGKWSLADMVDLTTQSSEALGLAGGAGLGEPAGYGGSGYGLIWRVEDYDTDTSVPMASVLDATGQVVIGPHPVTAISSTRRTPAITWSGTTYLMATAFGSCEPGDTLCKDSSVVITRIRPPSGDAWDDSGVELVQSIPALNAGAFPRRPTMATSAGKTYLAWFEGIEADGGSVPMIIRAAQLNQDGSLAVGPMLQATDASPVYSPSLTVVPPGLVIAWPENGNPDVAPHELGASRLKVVTVNPQMVPSGYTSVDVSAFYSWGSRAAAALEWPRGVMFVWTGRVMAGNSNQVHGVRLDCE